MADRTMAALVAGTAYFDDAAGYYADNNAAGLDYSSGAAPDDAPWRNSAAGLDYSSGAFYPEVAGEDDAAGAEFDESGRRLRPPNFRPGNLSPQALLRQAQEAPLRREIANLKQQLAHQTSAAGNAMAKWQMNAHQGDQPQLDLPFAFPTIGPGAGATITVTSPEPIIIVNMYVDPVQADACLINIISVGRLNLLLNATGVPANTFVPDARRAPMRSPRIPASTPIVITASNRTAATVSLNGTLRCLTLINA